MSPDGVPVIRIHDNLLVSLQGDLSDAAVLRLESEITQWVARTRAKGVLLDVSGLPVVDSFVARVIVRIAAMIRLLGAEAVVVGIQPAVAITLIELGIAMEHVHTALNAGLGLELLRRLRN
jgi:rsbT antagonist protein RsbS